MRFPARGRGSRLPLWLGSQKVVQPRHVPRTNLWVMCSYSRCMKIQRAFSSLLACACASPPGDHRTLLVNKLLTSANRPVKSQNDARLLHHAKKLQAQRRGVPGSCPAGGQLISRYRCAVEQQRCRHLSLNCNFQEHEKTNATVRGRNQRCAQARG